MIEDDESSITTGLGQRTPTGTMGSTTDDNISEWRENIAKSSDDDISLGALGRQAKVLALENHKKSLRSHQVWLAMTDEQHLTEDGAKLLTEALADPDIDEKWRKEIYADHCKMRARMAEVKYKKEDEGDCIPDNFEQFCLTKLESLIELMRHGEDSDSDTEDRKNNLLSSLGFIDRENFSRQIQDEISTLMEANRECHSVIIGWNTSKLIIVS